jgi:hypothetical protein
MRKASFKIGNVWMKKAIKYHLALKLKKKNEGVLRTQLEAWRGAGNCSVWSDSYIAVCCYCIENLTTT